MADSSISKNPHFAATTSKPSNLLCNFFIIVLALLLVPLIPSQAPDFITESSIFTKLWELLHLLFIGLAVCYGLFSKRANNIDLENHPRNDANSQAFLNRILDVSSFFENGLENSCGYDEKRLILHSSLSGKKHRSLLCENGGNNSSDFGEEKVVKSWNSTYFRGESMVVVANGEYLVDELGRPMSRIENKPLNLPVRSLRSRAKHCNKSEENDYLVGSNVSLEESFESDAEVEGGKVRGMVPVNLERRFERVAETAPIPWRLKSGNMEMREEISSEAKPVASHTRPHSAGEFDFEILKSRFIRQPMSSRTQSNPSSGREVSPSSMKMENVKRRKDLRGSSGRFSGPSLGDEASFVASKSSRHLSIGSSDEIRMQRNEKENLVEPGTSREEKSLGPEKKIWSFFDSDVLSPYPAKALSRGKSVRTFRSNKQVLNEVKTKENNSNFVVDDNAGQKNDELEGEKPEKPQIITDEPVLDSLCSVTEPTLSETQSSSETETSKENSASRSDSFQVSSDEEAGSDLEGSEVDRKAGEFIAKFREQIRLQKLASIKKHRG